MGIKRVFPSVIRGIIYAPPSKSITQRAVIMAMLAKGESVIKNPSLSDDSIAAIDLVSKLGVKQKIVDETLILESRGYLGSNKKFVLNCKESGLLLRMVSPVLSLSNDKFTLTGEGSLKKRPMGMIEKELSELGAKIKSKGGYPPIEITGPISGGKIEVDGSITSQFISGLLMALPTCIEDSTLIVNNLKSRPYINITLTMLKDAGIIIKEDISSEIFKINGKQQYNPLNLTVEGDWSSASFLLIAGAVAGEVTVKNLKIDSLQADKAILDVLDLTGTEIIISNNDISVKKGKLSPFEFDISESPDLFPPIAALAVFCNGKSTIYGTGRLKYKESNRTEAIKREFGTLGIRVDIFEDKVEIFGDIVKGGRRVSSHNDHRIAMALALTGLSASDSIEIEGWDSVSKSYKKYFDDLSSLGARIK